MTITGLGPIALRPGTAAGIPHVLRGRPRLLVDSDLTGSSVDVSSTGNHTYGGRTWETLDSGATEMTAGADGLLIDAGQNYARVETAIPGLTNGSAFCVVVVLELLVFSHQYGLAEIQLCQAGSDTDTSGDFRASIRKNTGSNYRGFYGSRGSSSFSMSYKGDNPAWNDAGLPSRVQVQIYGMGSWAQAKIGTGSDIPTFQSVTTAHNLECTIKAGSGTTAGSAAPAFSHIRIGCRGYHASGQGKMRVRHLRAWGLGGLS